MKNYNKGFIIPLMITIIAILALGGFYSLQKNKPAENMVSDNPETAKNIPASTTKKINIVSPATSTVPAKLKSATPEGVKAVIDANNQFAFDLYSALKKREMGNIFFSPYSLSTAFSMVYEGAKQNTASEIQKVFYFPADVGIRLPAFVSLHNQLNTANAKYQLNVANALWAQKDYKFLDSYISTLKNYYFAQASNLDFVDNLETSRLIINKWVESQTNNKIKDLFPAGSLDPFTRLVLTNAIYFKGTWVKTFDKAQTQTADFRVSYNNLVKVPLMQMTGEKARFNYADTADMQILEMPYAGDKLSMLVLLPKNDNLTALENSLSLKNINDWKNQMMERRVNVFIPKFSLDTKYFLVDTLSKLGMPTAFTVAADFSGMDGTKKLSIQKVIHQAFVSVDEQGTEAAASTGIAIGLTSASPDAIPVFRADHPFIFVIQDKTNGNILFLGRMENPAI